MPPGRDTPISLERRAYAAEFSRSLSFVRERPCSVFGRGLELGLGLIPSSSSSLAGLTGFAGGDV